MNRNGFALIAVLWMVTLLAGITGVSVAAVRIGQRGVQNRVVLTRARWAAESCLAIAGARWSAGTLADTATIDLGRTTTCVWDVRDPTAKLNINTADRLTLARLFVALGLPSDSAQILADAVVSERRVTTFTDIEPLGLLPAFDTRVLPFVTVDGPGPVNALAASRVVLSALPGLIPEAVHRITIMRDRGRPPTGLDQLAGELSPAARAALLAHYAELSRTLAFGRTQLVLTAHGWVATFGERPRATIELLVATLPGRLAVLRRRMR
jgi:type II secretory pathway component PulK